MVRFPVACIITEEPAIDTVRVDRPRLGLAAFVVSILVVREARASRLASFRPHLLFRDSRFRLSINSNNVPYATEIRAKEGSADWHIPNYVLELHNVGLGAGDVAHTDIDIGFTVIAQLKCRDLSNRVLKVSQALIIQSYVAGVPNKTGRFGAGKLRFVPV